MLYQADVTAETGITSLHRKQLEATQADKQVKMKTVLHFEGQWHRLHNAMAKYIALLLHSAFFTGLALRTSRIGWKLSSLKHLGSTRDLSAMWEVPGWTSQKASIPVWAKMTPIITDITVAARTALTAYAASSVDKHANMLTGKSSWKGVLQCQKQ